MTLQNPSESEVHHETLILRSIIATRPGANPGGKRRGPAFRVQFPAPSSAWLINDVRVAWAERLINETEVRR